MDLRAWLLSEFEMLDYHLEAIEPSKVRHMPGKLKRYFRVERIRRAVAKIEIIKSNFLKFCFTLVTESFCSQKLFATRLYIP